MFGTSMGLAGRPVREAWPNLEIIDAINRDSTDYLPGVPKILVVVVPNRPFFNQYPFRYYAAQRGLERRLDWGQFTSTGGETPQRWLQLLEWMSQYHYVIAADGHQGFTATRNAEITELLANGQLPFVPWMEFDLPDGSRSVIYRHRL